MNNTIGTHMPDWLAARAAISPGRPALLSNGECLTFRRLDQWATGVARRLAGLGIGPGDRVAVLLRNGAPMVALTHGVGRAGAILAPLNVRLAPAELAWQLRDVHASLLLYDEAHKGTVARLPLTLSPIATSPLDGRQSGTSLLHGQKDTGPSAAAGDADSRGVGEERLRALSLDALFCQCESDFALRDHIDLAAAHTIIYTSGTTGRPRGALLTYGNHWWSAMGSALNLGLRDDDRWLAVLPLFHVGGLSILMRSVIYGVPAIVHHGFDPARVNSAIDEDGVTIISVVATMLRRMLDERGDRPYPSTLRHLLIGGGPVPLPLLQESLRRGLPVVQTYGLTETASQAVTLPPEDALRKPGSAGKPLLPTELRIERAGRMALPGEVGEIVVRGPTVTPGYDGRPDETARAIRDGWLHTGDLGYRDGEGYLYVLDRRADLIISGGENVYPAEIEAVLTAHPSVAEAGVTGQDDATWGRVPVAFVVLRPDMTATPDDLTIFCRQHLARYKVPARVHVVTALPRNAAGKLLRRELAVLAPT